MAGILGKVTIMADVSGKSEAEMKINLSALKKHDPEIDEIIDTASGVAHYKFRSDSGVWVRCSFIQVPASGNSFRTAQRRHSDTLDSLAFFYLNKKKKKNFMAPFYGWGSTASRLEPLRGGSLLFTTKFPEVPGTHFIDLGRMKG